jgi:hypothetical protein
MFIGALTLAVVANLSSFDGADAWLLRKNYLSAAFVEVDAGGLDKDLLEPALKAARPTFASLGLELDAARHPDSPRVILRSGEAFPDTLKPALEKLGFQFIDSSSFSFFGRRYDRENDALVATFEDPSRSGLPVTIWYANSPNALAAYVTAFNPEMRPGFASFRHGELELSGGLDVDGGVQTTVLLDRRRAWSERFENDRRLDLVGFSCRVPMMFEVVRATDYLDILIRARRATLLWADPTGAGAETPVAAIGEMNVIVHGHVEEMQTLLDVSALSAVNPVTRTVHALLAPGVPHDGGAAVAESTARRFLGSPAEEWLAVGAGVSAAGTWWGRTLDEQVAKLVAADVVPSLEDLTRPRLVEFISPHVMDPLRGYLFAHLADKHGYGFVRDLWQGRTVLDVEAERTDWELALQAPVPVERTAQAMALGAWRAGAIVVPGPVGYGSRAMETSVADLKVHGASAVSLRATYFHETPEALVPGRLHRSDVPGLASDLDLASAAAAARKVGLRVGLELHVLSSASGGYLADLSLPSEATCEQFFADYEPALVHGALIADLLGADLFSCGNGLSNTTMPSALESINAIKRDGWTHLIELARKLFAGESIYTAGSQYELEGLLFADSLSVLSMEFFPRLDLGANGAVLGQDHKPDSAFFTQRLQGSLMRAASYAEAVGKPLFIGSFGFASARDGWRQTDWPRGAPAPELQNELYRSFRQAVLRVEDKLPGRLVGLMLWNWSSYPAAGGLADAGFTPQGKDALGWLDELLLNPHLE